MHNLNEDKNKKMIKDEIAATKVDKNQFVGFKDLLID